MTKNYLKAFSVDYNCYYKNEHGIPDDPKVANAYDISEAIEISKKKLTEFVGDSVEITSVSKGYNSQSFKRYSYAYKE